MAWLSRVNFTSADVLSFTDLNNVGNDIRSWGGNVNGGGYVLANVVLSGFDLSTCFNLPISTGVSGLGTGVATFLGTPSSANLAAVITNETGTGSLVFATSPTLVTPLLGTPTSGTLTSCTGLPISTGVSGLGASVATFLATPSSANLAAAVTDETGTGSLVFATSPTIATPTVTTSAVIPLVNGGTAVSSTLTLQSTSGAGSSDAIIFKTASQSEKMRILTTGEVGIGTASPGAKLTVFGDNGYFGMSAFFSLSSSVAGIAMGSTGTVGYLQGATGATSGVPANLALQVNGGNLGIGTASPGTKLEVSGSVYCNIGNVIVNRANAGANTSGSGVDLRIDGTTYAAIRQPAAEVLAFYRGSGGTTETMRIDTLGRVGVGASSPSNANSKLYIQTAATTPTQLEILQVGNALALLGNKASDTNFYITNDYDSTGLGVANRSITLTKTGEVGIGTTSPATSAKLDIGGTTGALLVPRLTTTERNALTAVNGMIIYNTTDNQMQGRINGAWAAM